MYSNYCTVHVLYSSLQYITIQYITNKIIKGVSVDAIDPAFQQKMVELLKTTGRPENVVGWYHSHPGFGCWLSGVDQNTQQAFESTAERAVAVVIDPIQSVKGTYSIN